MNNSDYKPLVSILITSYNRGNLISKAIDSVLVQNYTNIEIIIIDNNSTDNSDEILKEYELNNPKVNYIRNKTNLGPVPNMLKAINLAKGDYFTHVSSDDYLINENFITEAIEKSKSVTNPVIISARVLYLTDSSGILNPCSSYKKYENTFYKQPFVEGKHVFYEYTKCFPITMGACLLNRKTFMSLNKNDTTAHYFDLQVIMQLLLLGNAIFLDFEAYVVLLHKSNLSSSLQPATLNIENFSFIEAPYSMAKTLKSFDSYKLNKWKDEMLYKYSYQNLVKYYRYDKKEYQIFKKYIIDVYPKIYNRIKLDPKWIIYLIIFRFNIVANFVIKMRNNFLDSKLSK